MNIIKPPKLSRGDTIGIVATSFPYPASTNDQYYQEYQRGIQTLFDLGFKVKEGRNIKKTKWWFAGIPEERASDINEMYGDPEIKAVIVHEGGQSAIATLEHIDYSLVKQNPKPFIGFSDITNIHLAMFAQAGLIGFQGPLSTYSFGKVWDKYLPEKKKEGLDLFNKVLTISEPLGEIIPLTKWQCWQGGIGQGMLFGGNLSMMASLVGTKYFPSIDTLKGCLLFWEIDNTDSYRLERSLLQLKYAGLLDVISGMIIGKLPDIRKTGWEGIEEPALHDLIMTVLNGPKYPILAGVDFGHKTVAIPMPIGIKAEMDSDRLYLNFLESATKS